MVLKFASSHSHDSHRTCRFFIAPVGELASRRRPDDPGGAALRQDLLGCRGAGFPHHGILAGGGQPSAAPRLQDPRPRFPSVARLAAGLRALRALLLWSWSPAAAQTNPEAPPSVKISWDAVARVSHTTASLQLVRTERQHLHTTDLGSP